MADNTKIEWTEATWNPITGCTVHSAGCTNCYAMKLAGTRLRNHSSRAGLTTQTKAGPVWNGQVRFNEEWLTQPLKWKRPRMIFVCAHADLFHESVPDEWIDRIFAVMALSPQHTFQVLTKRSARMRAYFGASIVGGILDEMDTLKNKGSGQFVQWPLPNVWLGVSVENQAAADERIPDLLATPAAVRWISAEPLLGLVDLTAIAAPDEVEGKTFEQGWSYNCLDTGDYYSQRSENTFGEAFYSGGDGPDRETKLDWVVAGGESGKGARSMHPDWARSLRDQCAAAGTPFFFKQWGEWMHEGQNGITYRFSTAKGRAQSLPAFILKIDGTGHCFLPSDEQTAPVVLRVGKTAAGRLLDGVEHNGMPQIRGAA